MDHTEKITRPIHPREQANILSVLFFGYTGSILSTGFKKELEDDDLHQVIPKCRSKQCADRLEHAYLSQKKVKSPDKRVSLFRIIWNLYGLQYVAIGLFSMVSKLLISSLEPEALSNLIGYFRPGQNKFTFYDALYFAGMLMALKTFHALYHHNYMVFLSELALQIRSSFCSVIYRKALRLSPTALAETSLGNIVTVITKDVTTFEDCLHTFNSIWVTIIQTVFLCYLIYRRIGYPALVGVFILLGLVPFQAYTAKIIRNLRLKMVRCTDERLQRMQEALSTIKTVKMYTWEKILADKIGETRMREMKIMLTGSYTKIAVMISSSLEAKFAFYAILMLYLSVHNDMSAEDIFYAMKVFGSLRVSIAIVFSFGFSRLGEFSASLQRINHILELDELADFVDKPDDEPQIDFRDVSLTLGDRKILRHVDLKLQVGLNAVTGQLGGGKSSLIKVALRDFPYEGEVRTRGRKSYASQDPWLFPSSIKQNILFGEKYDYDRYKAVVSACALDYDFDNLEKGDETIVADGGNNLSKGQQARVNLARCVYKDSDIYLIDDALTALDPKVQEHIFQHCIRGLLKDKCVVLITHNSRHIKKADRVVVMHDGVAKSYENVQDVSEELLEAIEVVEDKRTVDEEVKDDEVANEEDKLLVAKPPASKKMQVYHENKKAGGVDLKLYLKYIKYSGGFLMGGLLLASYVGSTLLESTSEKMLSNWINEKSKITNVKERNFINSTIDLDSLDIDNKTTVFLNNTFNISTEVIHEVGRLELHADKIMNIYTMAIVGYAVAELVKNFLVLKMSLAASITLHKKMVARILNATMQFFDTYFIGNILNRFSQDLSVIDEQLMFIVTMVVGIVFHLVGSLGLIATINWKFIIPAIALGIFSFFCRLVYIRTARSLKRLEAATRSPLVGHLNSTMDGLTTIRAYKAQDILKDEFDRHQDLYSSAFYSSVCIKGAFAFAMDIASLFFWLSVVIRFLFFDTGSNTGDVGLTLTQAGMLSGIIQGGLMVWSEVEKNMTSFERAMEYTTVEKEEKTGSEPENWPRRGEIVFKKVSLRYANSDDRVLKGIDLAIKGGSKIGVVGRTGAGKSSLISVLFKLYDFEGDIHIDGTDVKKISSTFLRQHISIIPQDPIIFSSTVRSNVDPLETFTDEEVWKTLHKVHLDGAVPALDTQINELKFSTGQRQLMCLARAIIRKNKVVVLDEATANMDPETERVAQKIIDENFSSCTLIVIAHRLDSILDCDKVLVLNRGAVEEFDTPRALLGNPRGQFFAMLKNSGMQEDIDRIVSST
ncbi:unnamed protein product [Phyllotreta striolata]|uniref:Uncharacterized protein n=1 Tax=Phyllotreta striolata TaxID=444603 RepID=A0A9N9TY83_PHYSR|nr:unnamed protein product [Phyllotreta striolata]